MGLFDSFRKKNDDIVIGAVMKGKCINIKEVPDAAFADEILGKGVAIVPVDGKVYAPVDGIISMVFPTNHAIVMVTEEGAELLIHVGLDTVSLKGAPFTVHTEAEAKVKKGDLLMEADLDAIKAANLETITPIVVCNMDKFSGIKCLTGKDVIPGDEVMMLGK